MLKVTVAEVQRDVIKQLGIDLAGSVSFGTAVLDFVNINPFPIQGQALVRENFINGTWKSISGTLRAMERAGVIRTLAEPNLTAISGESATFLAGGEFPVPGPPNCSASSITGTLSSCQYSIEWKKFGVGLSFTPVVLAAGRISRRVLTEVSELSTENQLTLVGAAGSTFTVPSIKTRRAETTVEIPSGGSLAMAGMIAEQTKHPLN
jgi:pilus assembly protein CpaC